MAYVSEEEFNNKIQKIKKDNLSKERKIKLREEKRKYGFKIKLPSTSKLVLFGAILLCLQIVLFCEYVMITLGDTSAMYVLIGIPATLVPVIWGYYSKSKAENTIGGITYLAAEKSMNSSHTNENVEEHETEEDEAVLG